MVRKINLCFRNFFISTEKLPELALISLQSGLRIEKTAEIWKSQNYKVLAWFYDHYDNII